MGKAVGVISDCGRIKKMKTGFVYTIFAYLIVMGSLHAAPGPSSPILVLNTSENFGFFTSEILKTEGFNEFQADSFSEKITVTYLKNFDVVILTEFALTGRQSKILTRYVKEGGSLIAFRPDKKLSDVFGIRGKGGTVSDGYIAVNTSDETGKGIRAETLQFHGDADRYDLKGGREIAGLFKDGVTATGLPAVVMNKYGEGHAMAFLYNLPLSIVYTRQGNHRNAGLETDGITGIRAMDLFTNGWVDTTKNILNQADEQMRLLSHGIETMTGYSKPLPRFWYFPDALECLVTLNNDGEDNKETDFQKQFDDVYSKGAGMTLYVKELDLISKGWVDTWIGRGFEIAGHYDDTRQAVDPDWATMDRVYKNLNTKLRSEYGIDSMLTVTNHWFVWCGKDKYGARDFSAQARIEEINGIRLDCNYAHYDNGSNQGHFLGALGKNQGNYTGSGLIMKFADLRGDIINVYQQLNNVYDQQYMEHDDKEGYFNCFKGLMDRSLGGEAYSFISVKAHNAEYFFSEIPLMKMLDYANSKGIPVWTELKLLEFLRAKNEAAFRNLIWKDNQLSFEVKSTLKHSNTLTCMLPFVHNGKTIRSIKRDGSEQPYSVRSIKGFDYAVLTIAPGSEYSFVVRY